MRLFKNFDYKFVLGSNLLKSTFFGFKRQWDVNIRLSKLNGPCILVGAGWWQYGNKPNLYTKILLKSLLSKTHLHSVRDNYTLEMLKSIGINNVLNTSCATMWQLTPEHCADINEIKSDKVVFTLTDYNKDVENDTKLINILKENYSKIYFWPQGSSDFEYIHELGAGEMGSTIIQPTLEAFDNILSEGNVDYVGTRLHGGIRALQKKARTLIISIDNRAREKHVSFNLPIIERTQINDLDGVINSRLRMDIKIPQEEIARWKRQFQNRI